MFSFILKYLLIFSLLLSPFFCLLAQEGEYIQYHKDGKWGLYDIEENKLTIECKYDSIEQICYYEKPDTFDETNGNVYFAFQKNKLWGITTIDNKELIPAEYDSIKIVINQHQDMAFLLYRKHKWGVNDMNGKELVPCKYEQALFDDIIRIKQKGKWGAIDYRHQNKQIIPCKYDYIYGNCLNNFWHGSDYYNSDIDTVNYFFKVKNKNKVGLYKNTGEQVFDCIFEDIKFVENDKYWVRQNKKWRFVNGQQQLLDKREYTQIYHSGDVEIEGQMKYLADLEIENEISEGKNKIETKEEILEREKYEKEQAESEKEAIENEKELKAQLENIAHILYPNIEINGYEKIELFSSYDLYKIKKQKKWALFIPNDSILTAFEYDSIDISDNYSFIEVFKGKKFGYFDLSGEMLYKCEYEENPDQFTCRKEGKWGVLGSIPFIYDSLYFAFDSNWKILIAQKKNKVGAYYANGIQIVDCKYDSLTFFNIINKRLIWVKDNGKWGMLDEEEKIVLPFEYEYVKLNQVSYDSDYITEKYKAYVHLIYSFVCKNGKWGVIARGSDANTLPFEYQNIEPMASDNLILVQKDNLWGVFNLKTQRWLLPCKYDSFESLEEIEDTYLAGVAGDIGNYKVSNTRKALINEARILKMGINGKYLLVYVNGNEIIKTPNLYLSIEKIDNSGFLWARRENKCGWLSEEGQEYFE